MPLLRLQKILSKHFFRYSLIPIFVVEIALIILYFSINAYISFKNTGLILNQAQSHAQDVLKNESKIINDKLYEISTLAKILQNEHQAIFKNPNNFGLPNGEPSFDFAQNGVYYKTNKIGSSLYYSSNTEMGEKEKAKAKFTEAMDISLKSFVDTNNNIVAAYFNSWDNMNRLYPFIDKVYEQYGEHINMEDYNFYYLADLKHDPKKVPVWTGAYLDPAGNGWMLSCVVPIYNKNFLEGVTGIDMTIDVFVRNILERELPYDANLFMVDKNGMIIAMSEKIENLLGLKELKEHLYTDAILKTIEKPEEYNILKNKSPFASHFKKLLQESKNSDSLKIDDKEYLTLQQNVNETDWKLMILIDKSEIFDSITALKDLSNKIGYFAILFLIFFYLIFFYLLLKRINAFSKDITEPIVKLSEQTSKIKEADAPIEVFKTDIIEIYQLNKNFSNMMSELNKKSKSMYAAISLAEESSKAKDEFLANMSHELKTPLNSINVISSVMLKNKKGNLDDKDVQNLKVINNSGSDLLYLINDVLDISKLEAGEIKLVNEEIDVCSFIEEIFENFEPQVNVKNLDFSFNCNTDIGFIYSDKQRIKQVVINLLSNALKFTKKGSIDVCIKLIDDFIEFEVKDTGIGIPKDKLEHIFDRFKQVDSSTTRNYGGTGLGLAISKELISLLGGTISATSEEGKGSSFKFTIKTNKNLVNEERIKKLNQIRNTQEKEKVLIYNQDPVNFISLFVKLREFFEVESFNTFNKIAEKSEEDNFKYILLDTTSLSLEDILRLEDKKEKMIIFYDGNISYKNEIKDKFSYFFKKPFNIDEVISTIKANNG